MTEIVKLYNQKIHNVAIVGFGNIAQKHQSVAYGQSTKIIASTNRSEEGNALARKCGVPNTYEFFEEMIDKEPIDGIIVCVPFDKIFDVTQQLIPYQIPLLVEKPAGTSLSELDQLIALQSKYHTPVQVALNRRHYSVIHYAIADAGGIDQITSIKVEWSENPTQLLHQKGYTPQQVANIIFGNSIHGIDLMAYFAGNVEAFTAYSSKRKGDFRWLMNVNGKSSDGKILSFDSSWDNPVPWRMVMTTARKRYIFAPLETCRVQEEGKDEYWEIFPERFISFHKAGFYEQMKQFLTQSGNHHDLASTRTSMIIAQELYNQLNE